MRMIGGLPTSLRALVATPITRRSRALIGVTALAVAAGGLFVSGVLTSPASKTWSFGTQAGYIWQGRVGSVGASWTVPRIIGTSPCGRAGTWIGAEAPGNPSPFIQLGVNETCLEANGKRGVIYDAFWSDVKLHFHPRLLFFLHAGDVVAASLTLADHRWALALVDQSAGKETRFTTGDEATAAFNWAEWKQEDVAQTDGRPFPYPQLSAIRFRSLLADSAPPSSNGLLSTWMTVDGHDWGPSPVTGDSFGLMPTHISRLGAQYERIAVPDDAATEAFVTQLNRWTTSTPRAQIMSARSRFAAALRANTRAFAADRWPKPVGTLVGVLIQSTKALLARTLTPIPTSAQGLAAWRAAWTRQAPTIGAAASPVRKAVDLPDMGVGVLR